MITLENALERIQSELRPMPAVRIPVGEAAGFSAAETVRAPFDLPRFDYSAMDGYVVRSGDLGSASVASPVSLRLSGCIPAGAAGSLPVGDGECLRIFTGSPIPRRGNAVVMQEDVSLDPDGSRVWFKDSVKPWENIRMAGEDIRRDAPVLEKGSPIGLGGIALLASLGVPEVLVGGLPTVGVISTGSELREPGGVPLVEGEIYESNRSMILAGLKRLNALPKVFPVVPDDLALTREAIGNAFDACDLVITSGGVSVGKFDFVKEAFESLGGRIELWRIAVKPGKPFVFGQLGERFLFGLPGNPVSAFVTFVLLVAPAIRRLQGADDTSWPTRFGRLDESLSNPGDRRHFMRVHVNAQSRVRSAGLQASHALRSLSQANGLVDVPPGATLAVGSEVRVICWGDD